MIKRVKKHHATCTTFTDVTRTWSTRIKDYTSYLGLFNRHTVLKPPYFKTQVKSHATTYILK